MSPDANPLQRIVHTILFYAVLDGVRHVRLAPAADGRGLRVIYGRQEEGKQKMLVPMYVRKPLFDELRAMTDETGVFGFSFGSPELKMNRGFEMRVAWEWADGDEVADIALVVREGEDGGDKEKADLRF